MSPKPILYDGYRCSSHKKLVEKIQQFAASGDYQWMVGSSKRLGKAWINNVPRNLYDDGYNPKLHWFSATMFCSQSLRYIKKKKGPRFQKVPTITDCKASFSITVQEMTSYVICNMNNIHDHTTRDNPQYENRRGSKNAKKKKPKSGEAETSSNEDENQDDGAAEDEDGSESEENDRSENENEDKSAAADRDGNESEKNDRSENEDENESAAENGSEGESEEKDGREDEVDDEDEVDGEDEDENEGETAAEDGDGNESEDRYREKDERETEDENESAAENGSGGESEEEDGREDEDDDEDEVDGEDKDENEGESAAEDEDGNESENRCREKDQRESEDEDESNDEGENGDADEGENGGEDTGEDDSENEKEDEGECEDGGGHKGIATGKRSQRKRSQDLTGSQDTFPARKMPRRKPAAVPFRNKSLIDKLTEILMMVKSNYRAPETTAFMLLNGRKLKKTEVHQDPAHIPEPLLHINMEILEPYCNVNAYKALQKAINVKRIKLYDICGTCQKEIVREDQAQCVCCLFSHHLTCENVGKVPEGDWFCRECSSIK